MSKFIKKQRYKDEKSMKENYKHSATNQSFVTEEGIENIVTVASMAMHYPDLLTETQLKGWLKNRKNNGLEGARAILKVGRKIYLKRSEFFLWFLNQK